MKLPAIDEMHRASSWESGVNCCLVGGLVVQELHLSLGYVYTPPTRLTRSSHLLHRPSTPQRVKHIRHYHTTNHTHIMANNEPFYLRY